MNIDESSSLGSFHCDALVLTLFALSFLLALAAVVLWRVAARRRLRSPVEAAPRSLPLICPACHRKFAAGTVFCAVDACRLIATAEGASAGRAAAGGKCPRCQRSYDVGTRFCPADAAELEPAPAWSTRPTGGGLQVEADDLGGARIFALHFHGSDKICPVCTSKFDQEAAFCGRDGSELVAVN